MKSMTSLRKSCLLVQCRTFSISSCLWRRKPKPERDMSKRNLKGEALRERLKRREEDISRQQPYKNALADVIARFKAEVDEVERLKHDVQGELVRREMAEREQAMKNSTIIAQSNEELRKQREIQNLIDEDDKRRQLEEKRRQKQQEKEETRKRNTEMVLRLIEESKDFVTPDNIEDKIAQCLDKEINFNYAITSSGEKIYSTKPPGNLDGWKGPSPSAYLVSGLKPGSHQWSAIFKDHKTGFEQDQDSMKNT